MDKPEPRLWKRRRTGTGASADLGFAPRRVGFALGGGAVRGAAHIGVLQLFGEIGLTADLVVGTSIGALIGAIYAAGVPADDIADMVRDLHWRDLTRLARPRRLGLLETSRLRSMMREVLGDIRIDQLSIPFAAVACDITTGQRVVIKSGSVLDAVMASSAIPGLFVPVEAGDTLLVDGGVVDNVPVDVAYSMGADYVVAVDVMPLTHEARRPTDLRDMLLRSFEITQRSAHRDGRMADCYIAPDVGGLSMTDFAVAEEIRCRGYEAATKALPQLEEDLGLASTGERLPR